MSPTVHVETSVVSYLTARPSRDVVVAAYQEVTREWWRSAPNRFVVYISALVMSEARTGDPEAHALVWKSWGPFRYSTRRGRRSN